MIPISFSVHVFHATFQRMMNNVLSCSSGTRCIVFLDDIYIYANSLVEHDGKLQDVLEKFKKHSLKFQPSKSEFFRKELPSSGTKSQSSDLNQMLTR